MTGSAGLRRSFALLVWRCQAFLTRSIGRALDRCQAGVIGGDVAKILCTHVCCHVLQRGMKPSALSIGTQRVEQVTVDLRRKMRDPRGSAAAVQIVASCTVSLGE